MKQISQMVSKPKINIFQGSLATMRRGDKHVINCYIANYCVPNTMKISQHL